MKSEFNAEINKVYEEKGLVKANGGCQQTGL
jgi:hypothetical protein